jgi:hypothetical protein
MMSGKSRVGSRQRNTINRGRRRFIEGIAAAGAVAAFGLANFGESSGTAAAVLRGDRFDLVIDSLPVNFTGRRVLGTALNGSVPGPILLDLEWRSRLRSSSLGEVDLHPERHPVSVLTTIQFGGLLAPQPARLISDSPS